MEPPPPPLPHIKMNGVSLQSTNSIKYLGVIIMYRARNYLTKNSLKSLYFSYIYPDLTYCVEIWGISPQTHLKPLLFLQKKIVRIMTFSTYCAHTGSIFKDLNILTIDTCGANK